MPGNNPEEQGCLSGDAERIAPGSERGLPFMLFNFVPAVCYCFANCVCRGLKLSFVLLDSPEILMVDEPFLSLHFRRKTVKLRWWNSHPNSCYCLLIGCVNWFLYWSTGITDLPIQSMLLITTGL